MDTSGCLWWTACCCVGANRTHPRVCSRGPVISHIAKVRSTRKLMKPSWIWGGVSVLIGAPNLESISQGDHFTINTPLIRDNLCERQLHLLSDYPHGIPTQNWKRGNNFRGSLLQRAVIDAGLCHYDLCGPLRIDPSILQPKPPAAISPYNSFPLFLVQWFW